jgi:hypothetical protein
MLNDLCGSWVAEAFGIAKKLQNLINSLQMNQFHPQKECGVRVVRG